ncbi:MAG: hypothetical protein HOG49_36600 [Candidatus Scalindua sp.]|jgi:ABC-type molybdate transport system substrate-binding protein|nr:hypothetical protein [Candidatus Scalindua sp.]
MNKKEIKVWINSPLYIQATTHETDVVVSYSGPVLLRKRILGSNTYPFEIIFPFKVIVKSIETTTKKQKGVYNATQMVLTKEEYNTIISGGYET